jgi:hypothetical protein
MNFSNDTDFQNELRSSKLTLTGEDRDWTERESVIFWSCVNIYGQEFALISPFFPDRPLSALESFYHIHGYTKVTLTSFPAPDTTSSSNSSRSETTFASQSPVNDLSDSSQPKEIKKNNKQNCKINGNNDYESMEDEV